MRFGILNFPGSNCDHDCYWVVKNLFSQNVEFVWHKETSLSSFDVMIIPGGFSYGDYLRCGAIARFSPVMKALEKYVKQGGLVLGICNGFQILLESGILPGVMLRNQSLKFVCKDVFLKVENNRIPFTRSNQENDILKLPIAHADGNYFVDSKTLKEMEKNHQIVFRYCNAEGKLSEPSNPNGSLHHIAGICNKEGNVLGLMPHPERACDPLFQQVDGRVIFDSLIHSRIS
ncbi:MAG TPA: phosphoribosylformylglycinamidine synthase subunit PurQ [Nitrospiria bacterium]